MIQIYDYNQLLVSNQFNSSGLFAKALKCAFEDVVRLDVSKGLPSGGAERVKGGIAVVHILTNFCDRLLKSGGEKFDDATIDQYLDNIVQLMVFLPDKDIFCEEVLLF